MSERLESWAIILSAGKGTRMKSNICKQYMQVEGKPLLFYTLKAFEESTIDHIVLVVGKNDASYVQKEIVDRYKIGKVHRIVIGGRERYDSVMNGLDVISDNGKVLVHDGARPLIEVEYINNDEEKEYKVKKSVKVKDTKDKANIRYRKLYKKYAKSKKVVTKSKLAGAKVDSHMMPEEITSKLITDDEAKARRITDDYEKARYSNGEVSEEDISFLKNFK